MCWMGWMYESKGDRLQISIWKNFKKIWTLEEKMFGNSLINCIHISYFRAQFTLVVKRAGHITLENWTPPKALGRFRAPGQREKLGIEQFDLLHTYRLRKQKKVLILPKLGIKIRKLKMDLYMEALCIKTQ